MYEHKSLIKVLGAAIAVAILLGLVAGVRTFQVGNLQHAEQIASRLQAAAIANPSPVAGTTPEVSTSAAAATSSTTAAAAASRGGPTGGPAPTPAAPGTAPKSPVSTATHASVAPSAAPSTSAAVTSTPSSTAKAAAPSTAAPRRQPSAAELSQAISAVHSLLPFFTPTVAQLASSGDQVCTALDQGVPFSQLEAQALNLVGAGSISWMIPSSVPDTAIRTLVALYCPANAAKIV